MSTTRKHHQTIGGLIVLGFLAILAGYLLTLQAIENSRRLSYQAGYNAGYGYATPAVAEEETLPSKEWIAGWVDGKRRSIVENGGSPIW